MSAHPTNQDYYHILQVSPRASFEVIKSAYRALLKDGGMHPDLGGSAQQAQVINEAYQVLSEPAARREYDAMLQNAAHISPLSNYKTTNQPDIFFCPHCKTPCNISQVTKTARQRCPACKRLLFPSPRNDEDEAKNAQRLGIFLFEKGMAGRALREFETALSLRPQSHALYYWKGRCLYSRHLCQKAKLNFAKATQLQPTQFHYHFWLGQACFATDYKHEAIIEFNRALVIRPHHAGALLRLANCHYELGSSNMAKALLEKGLVQHPDQAQMYILLGFILIRQGHSQDALKVFLRLQKLSPSHALAKKYIALLSAAEQNASCIMPWC